MPKQKLIFCTQKINKSNIRRENRDGVEHIVLTSFTLPPDIVMNGGLYPTEEIEKSFNSLNRTPVTIEHPEINGMYVSANDPEIDFEYRFGAFNENARRTSDGRIALDKVINVQKALKVEKGKRLLDRIEEIENNSDARPLHTSVGVFLEVETLEKPQVNDQGQTYDWIGRDMVFDHDAILLDSVGASTPEQGTGIGVNNQQIKVSHFVIEDDQQGTIESDNAKDMRTNKDMSFSQITRTIHDKINQGLTDGQYRYVEEVYDDTFVYCTESHEMFLSNYAIDDNGNLEIQDTRLPVERVVEYKPVNPQEDNAMRDKIIAELAAMGVTVNADISDAELMAKYNQALIADKGDDAIDVADVVANAVKSALEPIQSQIDNLGTQLQANSDKELDQQVDMIVNSGKYPGLDAETLKSLGPEKVRSMATNCQQSFSIGNTMGFSSDTSQSNDFQVNTEISDLPE